MASVESFHAIRAADPGFGSPARFDRVARIYRVMEYLTFGPLLERCRFQHLSALRNSRRALVIGDGDGRFLTQLLATNPTLRADAVDASSAMLALLSERVTHIKAQHRIATTQADARAFQPSCTYDLVCTHFFLDCLTESEADHFIARIRPHLAPGGQWLVSEFQIPDAGRLKKWIARTIISVLYAAFRLLTGLTVRQIPPWPRLLTRHGFQRKATRNWLGGLLISELWEATAPGGVRSHSSMPLTTEFHLTSIPGIDPGPLPIPDQPTPTPDPAPGPPPDPDPEPYPGPIPAPQPVT
jgi:ubiquinone/menaquinone biosynthesis C-methylase UbiE